MKHHLTIPVLITSLFLATTPGLSAGQAGAAEKAPAAKKAAAAPESVTIIVEFIELELDQLTQISLEHEFTTDATMMRVVLQELIENGDAAMAAMAILQTRSGQRAKTEAVTEIIYPTEVEPEHPVKFETRNAGLTVEVDPVVSADGQSVEINIVPEYVEHVSDVELGPTASGVPVKAPLFHTAKLTTSVTAPNGRYVLLGTTALDKPVNPARERPIILVFLRATAHE